MKTYQFPFSTLVTCLIDVHTLPTLLHMIKYKRHTLFRFKTVPQRSKASALVDNFLGAEVDLGIWEFD